MLIPEVAVAVFFATSVVSQKVIELSESHWTLENLPLNITVPGAVPSQAHLDLYAAQVIGDPYASERPTLAAKTDLRKGTMA